MSKSARNKTIELTENEKDFYSKFLDTNYLGNNCIINNTFQDVVVNIPNKSVDLLILDPPYNLNKKFGNLKFTKSSVENYADYLEGILKCLIPVLKDTATVYLCSDWYTSLSIYPVLSDYFTIRNRITWEREKGRGSKSNWKNASEDIWFCTMGNDYTFNVDTVKLRRKVIAPYRDKQGNYKDHDGKFRDTHPSNLWTDISVPFWSMPENTDHPTQKPEKLIAKMILASSNPNDVVLDPFLGSGTTAVVAEKLRRQFIGIEQDKDFCLVAQKRLEMAIINPKIQGYSDGIFWERNSKAK